ncbi:MAG: AMP-binding protein [Candidatus Cloacimonetes bacterium]|nr:AMP-binding protein [Candidatus Cloacimonadota bacterium]
MQLQWVFINKAHSQGKKTALFDTITDRTFSYNQLLIGSLLLKDKISYYSGKYIGIMLPPGAGSILAILGSLMNGKVPALINYSTGALENAHYAQNKCYFRTIITSRRMLEKLNLEPIEGMVFIEDWLAKITYFKKLGALIKSKIPLSLLKTTIHDGNEDETAIILFTSGSEKEPKAVQLTHRNFMHNIENVPKIINLSSEDIFITNLPYFHVFGLTVNLWLPIYLGATIVGVPNPLDYKSICDAIKKYQVSVMVGTPTFFWGYLKKADTDTFKSVRIAIAGADKLQPRIRQAYIKKHNLTINEGYGTTETSPVISTNTPTDDKPGSVGRPLPGVSLKICDIETGKELPAGQEGKILVKGDLVMKGYFGDLEETSLRIKDGWYDTGDMGVLDEEGYLWHRGRLKRFVKIGGEMISLVKIEGLLEEIIPEGSVCCVVDVPNLEKGADIVACVTTEQIDKNDMIKHLRDKLPPIAIPKEFYVIEDLPMMPSGKVDFREVEKICREKRDEQKAK